MDAGVKNLIARLGLIPHPNEGGYFRETYRSTKIVEATRPGIDAPRAVSTAIYYLLTPETLSAMHRVRSDEMFHFYLGDAVEQVRVFPGGGGEVVTIGTDIAAGETPQTLVSAGVWQGARLKPGGRFALMGCTVAPGFDYADYEHGRRDELVSLWPDRADAIAALTPADPVVKPTASPDNR